MKKTLFILIHFSIFISLSGSNYYISPDGNDLNPGTILKPFFTLDKAWSKVSAGDIIYMRSGRYHYYKKQELSNKSGTSDKPIVIQAYPGEKPVIDFRKSTETYIGIRMENCSYIFIKGIRITNMSQPEHPDSGMYGLILWDNVNNCRFEQLETDHIEGWGVVIGDHSSNILFLNCDSHHNADPRSDTPYDGSDGFESGSLTSTNITFSGCRSWSNSDDGWDFRQANGVYKIENCWSFWNGFIPDSWVEGGNGDGYKLGGKTAPPTNKILRTITHSIAYKNRGTGITPEPDAQTETLGVLIYNCTTYGNAMGWGNGINTGGFNNYTVVKNCIDFENTGRGSWMQSSAPHNHNSFDIPLNLSEKDFLSLDPAGIDGPRRSDGSLPDLTFLHPSEKSHLIDAGIDVGLPFTGKAPDVGAFESKNLKKTVLKSKITSTKN